MVANYKKNVIAYYKDKTKTMVTSINNPFFKLKLDLVLYYCKDNYAIFEAGCGNGNFGLLLAQKIKSYYGVDFTYDMLTYFRERTVQNGMTNVFLVNGDLTSLPIKNNQFDLIFSYSTLYYIIDIKNALKELNRILKENGIAIFEFGTRYNINAVHSVLRYNVPQFFISPWSINSLLSESGFSILIRRYFKLIPSFLERGIIAKMLLNKEIGNISVDEWISSLPILRNFAMKQIIVCQKR